MAALPPYVHTAIYCTWHVVLGMQFVRTNGLPLRESHQINSKFERRAGLLLLDVVLHDFGNTRFNEPEPPDLADAVALECRVMPSGDLRANCRLRRDRFVKILMAISVARN